MIWRAKSLWIELFALALYITVKKWYVKSRRESRPSQTGQNRLFRQTSFVHNTQFSVHLCPVSEGSRPFFWNNPVFYIFSTTTLHRFFQNAIPYAKISFLPSSRSSWSYPRSLIWFNALSHAWSRSLIERAYFSSKMIPVSGFFGLIRISACLLYTSPSPRD